MIRPSTTTFLFFFFAWGSSCPIAAGVSAKVEIVDPFPVWVASESADLYIRVINTGDKSFTLLTSAARLKESDLRFEWQTEDKRAFPAQGTPPIAPGLPDGGGLFADAPAGKAGGFVRIPPSHAYVLSERDYPECQIPSESQMGVRVHVRIADREWIASDWVRRTIIPCPKFPDQPLFRFRLEPGDEPELVSAVELWGEKWLFARVPSNPYNLWRLCRLPSGTILRAIEHDMQRRRLTLRFGEGEPDVMIDSRGGQPLSGSERTVPHLHLWKKLSGRPFTDNYQLLMIEGAPDHTGPTPTKDLIRTTVPAAAPPPPEGTGSRPEAGSGKAASSAPPGPGSIWAWVAGGAVVVLCAWAGLRAKGRG